VAVIAKSTGGPYFVVDGWTYFIAPPAPPGPDVIGRYCVVGLPGGQSVLRFVRRGYKPGTVNLVSLVGASLENASPEWVSPVLLIRPA
jgi:hypothetical protein